jgi:hypothetical protein
MSYKKYAKFLNSIANQKINDVIKRHCIGMIGCGIHRNVYSLHKFDDVVLKIEKSREREGWFTNACEWRNWMNYEHTPVGKWLAPCYAISDNAMVLIQARAQRKIDNPKLIYPKQIPDFLSDTKYFNYGFIKDTFVCFDYPFLHITDFKMKTARWRKQ